MKKFLLVIYAMSVVLFVSGCSSTWEGVKEDTSNAWNNTRRGIHNATE